MPYEIINPTGKANIIFICEHASNHMPPEYDNLGLDDEQLSLHIAWDIGIGEVTKRLAGLLDATAIIARFSRLLIDANRALDQDGLIPDQSDGHIIPANQDLTQQEINKRIDQFYHPFHRATQQIIKSKSGSSQAPIIFDMHSFTPSMNGTARPWEVGMLWDKDSRLFKELLIKLSIRSFNVGDNKPYTGRELNHTMNSHGANHGFPHVNIEIRQDEIDHSEGIDKWSNLLAHDIKAIRKLPQMSHIKHY